MRLVFFLIAVVSALYVFVRACLFSLFVQMCGWISISETKDVSKMKEWHFEYSRLWLFFLVG